MRVALVINPLGDRTFGASVHACSADGSDTPDALQTALRADWPNAIVRDGIVESDVQRWYVYRDGHWIRDESRISSEEQIG